MIGNTCEKKVGDFHAKVFFWIENSKKHKFQKTIKNPKNDEI